MRARTRRGLQARSRIHVDRRATRRDCECHEGPRVVRNDQARVPLPVTAVPVVAQFVARTEVESRGCRSASRESDAGPVVLRTIALDPARDREVRSRIVGSASEQTVVDSIEGDAVSDVARIPDGAAVETRVARVGRGVARDRSASRIHRKVREQVRIRSQRGHDVADCLATGRVGDAVGEEIRSGSRSRGRRVDQLVTPSGPRS